jgi:membrane-associated phospholipid phosphatase
MKGLLSISLCLVFAMNGFTQNAVTTDTSKTTETRKPYKEHKTRLGRASIFPAILIGYSLTTWGNRGLFSDIQARTAVRKNRQDFYTKVDDALIFAPYVELLALNIFKVKCQNDFINTSLLILKSELIMTAIVFPTKTLTARMRPDSSSADSYPSGHTATAFVAASIVHKEYRYRSQWFGVGAYAIATSVAAFRMLNNKHWQSDVIAGAGVGLLSAHIAYATHQYRWGRKEVCMDFRPANIPVYSMGGSIKPTSINGITMSLSF